MPSSSNQAIVFFVNGKKVWKISFYLIYVANTSMQTMNELSWVLFKNKLFQEYYSFPFPHIPFKIWPMNDRGGGGWSTVTVYTKILKYVLRKCSNHRFFYQQTSESYFWFSSVIISPYSIHYNPTLQCWASWSTPSVHAHNLSLRFRHYRKTIFQKLVSWLTYLSRIDIVGSEIGINTIVKSLLIIVVLFLVRIP